MLAQLLDFGAQRRQIALPGAHDAVMLRVWDDLAKQAGLATPTLSHFLERATRCALSAAAGVAAPS